MVLRLETDRRRAGEVSEICWNFKIIINAITMVPSASLGIEGSFSERTASLRLCVVVAWWQHGRGWWGPGGPSGWWGGDPGMGLRRWSTMEGRACGEREQGGGYSDAPGFNATLNTLAVCRRLPNQLVAILLRIRSSRSSRLGPVF